MVRVLTTIAVLLVVVVALTEAKLGLDKICTRDSQFKDVCLNAGCKCETKEGTIDLTPMTSLSKLKAFMPAKLGSFDYHPCKPFSESQCKNVLMCEKSLLTQGAPVAVASGVRFSQCGDGIVLRYKAKAFKKSADVYLTCNKTTDGTLYYMGMNGLASNHYEFEMQSKYACEQGSVTTPKTTMPTPATPKSTPKSTPATVVTTHRSSPKPTPAKTSPKPTTPAKTSPKPTPGKTTPAKTTPKSTPGKTTPIKTSPAKTTPKSTPAKTTPAKTTPKKTTPRKTTPRKTTPKKTTPQTPAKTSPKMPMTTTPTIPKTTPGAASSICALPSLLMACSLLALRRFV